MIVECFCVLFRFCNLIKLKIIKILCTNSLSRFHDERIKILRRKNDHFVIITKYILTIKI